jgi:two-component system NtrC family sensor kinase
MYINRDRALFSASQSIHRPRPRSRPSIPNCPLPPEQMPTQPGSTEPKRQDRHLFGNSCIGIFHLTSTGQYLKVNQRFAEWHGYASAVDFLTVAVEADAPIEVDRHQHQTFLEILRSRGHVTNFESHRYRCDGSTIWLSLSAQAFENETGAIYYEGFATDITAYKKAERCQQECEAKYQAQAQQLQQLQAQVIQSEKLASLGQLLAGVAHEINNPVSFIYGNISPAEDYAQDLIRLVQCYQSHYPQAFPEIEAEVEAIDLDFLIEDFPKILTSMKIGAERIRQIIQSLRTFSHLNDETQHPVNIHQTLDSTLLLLQPRLKPKGNYPGVTVIKDYGSIAATIPAYSGLLSQVFMNLLVNAIDALEDALILHPDRKPLLRIQTEQKGDRDLIIRIIDNGVGIPTTIRDKIFESFFTTKPTGKGTGLGLAISHQIITEKHHGQLTCHAMTPCGTAFEIQLPIS